MAKLDAKFYGEIRKAKDDSVVPEDQWVTFLIKDNAFWRTLPTYYYNCVSDGCDSEQLAATERMIERGRIWREANPELCKRPDAKGEKLLG